MGLSLFTLESGGRVAYIGMHPKPKLSYPSAHERRPATSTETLVQIPPLPVPTRLVMATN